MQRNIPRCDGPNPTPEPPRALPGWTWHALIGLREPPAALGRTPEAAEDALRERLRAHFRASADPLPDAPDERAEDALRAFRRGALLSVSAADEVAAFLAWKQVSCLTAEEALLRWRLAFPTLDAPDPLVGVLFREERAGLAIPQPRPRRLGPRGPHPRRRRG